MNAPDPIARTGREAIWKQIAHSIESQIASGTYARGDRLPTESSLAEEFGVNRHTVRRALSDLTSQGLIKATRGRGTFVAQVPVAYPITERTRFSEIVSAQNRQHSGRLIGHDCVEATEEQAKTFGIATGDALTRLETLGVVDGQPVLVGTSYFPLAAAPNIITDYAETGSISTSLARVGLGDYRRAKNIISAAPASFSDSKLLKIAAGSPVLVLDYQNKSPDGSVIQIGTTRLTGEASQLIIDFE